MNNRIIVITGPTASGKSAVVDSLVKVNDRVIVINADSKQVYRDVPIITDQPQFSTDVSEKRYFLYGHVDISVRYSVAQWLLELVPLVKQALNLGKVPIVVGGSMMYIESLIHGLSPLPDPDPKIIEKWDQLYCNLSREQFNEKAKTYMGSDNPYLDRYRSVRNLACFEKTGCSLPEWHKKNPRLKPLGDLLLSLLILNPDKNILHNSVKARIESMLNKGVIAEIKMLNENDLIDKAKSILGVEQFSRYIKGECSLDYAKYSFIQKSCYYAKKQVSWFRNRFPEAEWYSNSTDLEMKCISLF